MQNIRMLFLVPGLLLATIGCSTSSPTAPSQTPPPPVVMNDIDTSSELGEMSVTYAHVLPNVYSEIYVAFIGLKRGRRLFVDLHKGSTVNAPIIETQKGRVDDMGLAHFTFRITQRRRYYVHVSVYHGEAFKDDTGVRIEVD